MQKGQKRKSALIKVAFLAVLLLSLVITIAACNTTYTITFNTDGGSTIASQTVKLGDKVTRPPANPTKTGYTFIDWYKEGKEALFEFDNFVITSKTTIYAKYRANTYSVIYAKNHADASGDMPNSSHTYDEEKALTANTYIRANYYLAGWNTKANGTGTSYAEGESVKNLTIEDGVNVTLYAEWAGDEYEISYMDVGGDEFSGVLGTDTPETHSYGTITTLVNPTRENYTFAGWFANEEGTGEPITTLAATAYTDGIELFAKWIDVVKGRYTATSGDYNLYLVLNGDGTGTITLTEDTDTLIDEEEITYTLTNDGFVIDEITITNLGDVSANAGFEGGALTNFELHIDDEDIEFELINIYSINYMDVGGNAFSGTHGANHPTEYIYDRTISLVSPTKTGFTFKGWFLNQNGTGVAVTELEAEEYNADITLYAKWGENQNLQGRFVASPVSGSTLTLVLNGNGTGTISVTLPVLGSIATNVPITYSITGDVFTLNAVNISTYNISGSGKVEDGTIKNFSLSGVSYIATPFDFVKQA